MTLILTMAGLGSRFKNQGYTTEKYAIKFLGHSLFEWSLVSLLAFREHSLVVVTRDFSHVQDDVLGFAHNLGFRDTSVLILDRETKGQAETAFLAKPKCSLAEPVLIYNTDTHVNPLVLRQTDFTHDGWIPCFSATGEKWSFVETDDAGFATRVTEKLRISDKCSIGLYGFSSFSLFEEAYIAGCQQPGELYIAPLYSHLIDRGYPVTVTNLKAQDVCVLGTPEDLEAARLNPPSWPR